MAVPADLQEQITRLEARLRLVPADEIPPSPEVREAMRVWQTRVHNLATVLRGVDDIIEHVVALPESAAAERERMLATAHPIREQAFALMARLNPDQAWFWTEEWQVGEREVDREIAAGNVTTFATLEEFDAALDALDVAAG
jgi:hypothetical protein